MALDFLLAPDNTLFTGALAAAGLLAVVEVVGLLTGLSVAAGEGDGAGAGAGNATGLSAVLGWVNPGQLPLLALVMVFCASFGVLGLAVQSLAALLTGAYATPLAFAAGLLLGLPATRAGGRVLARLLPRDEGFTLGPRDYIGCRGRISIGPAAAGSPGRATVKDRYGRLQNLSVLPMQDAAALPTGAEVLIVDHDGTHHLAAPFTPPPTP